MYIIDFAPVGYNGVLWDPIHQFPLKPTIPIITILMETTFLLCSTGGLSNVQLPKINCTVIYCCQVSHIYKVIQSFCIWSLLLNILVAGVNLASALGNIHEYLVLSTVAMLVSRCLLTWRKSLDRAASMNDSDVNKTL